MKETKQDDRIHADNGVRYDEIRRLGDKRGRSFHAACLVTDTTVKTSHLILILSFKLHGNPMGQVLSFPFYR